MALMFEPLLRLMRIRRSGYRPERHYMRGTGPKCLEKTAALAGPPSVS